MSTQMVLLAVGLGFLLVILILAVGIHNRLVALKNRYVNGFSQIAVQLRRRYDLIPNLVETAKAYLKHERETLEAVIAARNQASTGLAQAAQNPTDSQAIKSWMGAEGTLLGALGRFSMVMEAYPDLQANANIMQLREELTSTENKIAFARQAYNDWVTEFNTYRESFPNVVLANMFGYNESAEVLEFADAKIEEAPQVALV